jgi:guanyl-specific ribonuclease Sa
MSTSENAILNDTQRGAHVEADGNAPAQSVQAGGVALAVDSQSDPNAQALGPNNERLEQAAPRLVNALRELVVQFRQEGIVARRHEIRRIRQARLFWQGLQYAWWNPQDMNWHLPWEAKIYDDSALEEMPRYQFVTNLYQAFGLSFVSVISQDVPATRFYPQSTLSEADVETAKAASQVADLVEQNNRVQQLLTGVGFYLWTDGKIGGYVRYVADGQRFGWREELLLEERWVRLGRDAYVCANCGAETEVSDRGAEERQIQQRGSSELESAPRNDNENGAVHPGGVQNDNGSGRAAAGTGPAAGAASFFAGAICPRCGAALGANDFRPAPVVPVPQSVGTRRVANGQEVISIVGGLELNTPVWANEQYEFPYLQWQMEVHRAKLKAAYPHAADKIQMGGPIQADDVYARATRIAVAQGMPTIHPGDALFNLVTFSRTWIRPWAFYSIEDAAVRDQLLRMFPDGCYVAFAGETYCESRNESMDDCWRVMHALPGDGQNRPSVGDSLIELQERYNTLSNIQAETYDYGIPPIYADPQVLDFDALANQTAEPAAHYPARARPGMSLADGFFQPSPAQVPPDMLRHQQDLIGPIAQFLTGLFPAVFGGEMENVKTASGYAMARDQALGRLGLVWRRLKAFYCDVMLLAVDCFRKNRPGDVEIPFLGAGGEFQARFIRLANLKGNIQAHPESDETFPRLKSQQRAVVQQLMTNPDPAIQAALREPANLGFIKSLVGLSELVVPGEDARNKQLREIQLLLTAEGPLTGDFGLGGITAGRSAEGTPGAPAVVRSTVPVDELLDDHATEFEECRRWASSDAGQIARAQNPAGFANVRAHAAEHAAALARQQAQGSEQPNRKRPPAAAGDGKLPE